MSTEQKHNLVEGCTATFFVLLAVACFLFFMAKSELAETPLASLTYLAAIIPTLLAIVFVHERVMFLQRRRWTARLR